MKSTYSIPSLSLHNLDIESLVYELGEYFAENGDCEMPAIISDLTGEGINSVAIDNEPFTIEELLNLAPYLDRILN